MTKMKVIAVRLLGEPNETKKMTIVSSMQLQRPLGDYKGVVLAGDLNKDHIKAIKGFLDMLDEAYDGD